MVKKGFMKGIGDDAKVIKLVNKDKAFSSQPAN
jgi:hypothetical protein